MNFRENSIFNQITNSHVIHGMNITSNLFIEVYRLLGMKPHFFLKQQKDQFNPVLDFPSCIDGFV